MLLQLITLRSRHAISLSPMWVCVGGGGGGVREEVRGRGGETVRGRLLSFLEICSRFLGIQSAISHYNASFCKNLRSRD